MTKTSETIVFFGSGPVAAASLKLLIKHVSVEAVITKSSTLAEMSAISPDLIVYDVNNTADLDELIATRKFKSHLGILIDFGIIVSQTTIDYFSLGIINSHFSLLPELRGADPITFSILSGQAETGVSLMLLVKAMDEGPLLAQVPFELSPTITTPQLTEYLVELSDQALQEIVPLYMSGQALPISQEQAALPGHETPSYSRKLTKADGILDWSKPAIQLEREIRAFQGWPKSRTELGGKEVIVTEAHAVLSQPVDAKPGDVEVIKEASSLMVSTGSGALCIDSLKPAGKSDMPIRAFLAGYGHLL